MSFSRVASSLWQWRLLADEARGVRTGLCARVTIRQRFPQARVAAGVHVIGPLERITLAPNVYIGFGSIFSLLNGGGLESSHLEIGASTYIGEYNNVRTAGCPIRIGSDCQIAQVCTLVGSNHGTGIGGTIMAQRWVGEGIDIADDVWIGAGVTLLPGAKLRAGCVIAANSVVRGVVPSGLIFGGVPAREIGRRGIE